MYIKTLNNNRIILMVKTSLLDDGTFLCEDELGFEYVYKPELDELTTVKYPTKVTNKCIKLMSNNETEKEYRKYKMLEIMKVLEDDLSSIQRMIFQSEKIAINYLGGIDEHYEKYKKCRTEYIVAYQFTKAADN